ncbi:MAG: alpha/beta fold hydrolase [Ectothiorhodospiraceae bacterium]|nr:alpha/beta fold hydrolase [Ectothiorhodospiraceae bacterium]
MKQHPLTRMWQLGLGLLAAATLAACQTAPTAHYQVTDMRTPAVKPGGSEESFWRERVVYPFDTQYATVRDDRGVAYEIAYMDEYRGDDPEDAPVLILVHGKGSNAGSFALLMRDALEAGLRVIAFDIPHYGKSIPGNLDRRTFDRTLQDTREAVQRLLVEELGVTRATHMGHSMGGQWSLGYALHWPDQVERLILVAPSGLEEYPRVLQLPTGEMPWMDPAYKRDLTTWEEVWAPLGRLEQERAMTEQAVRDFYYFRRTDPETGETRRADVGFFLNDSIDAQFLTETRVGMIDGHPEEYEAWIYAFIRDIYTMGIELNREDPDSLVKRLDELEMPVAILFGEEDPLIPTTVVTGNQDVRWDLVRPAWEKLSERGPRPTVKFYQGAAHFPHVDVPDAFNADIIRYTLTGRLHPPTENPARYQEPAPEIPDDLKAFLESDREAVLAGDIDAVMEHYHPDYLDDGRDFRAQREFLRQILPMLQDYRVEITGLEMDGNRAVIQGAVVTNFGAQRLPRGAMMIQEDGHWYWYGNQR